MSPSIGMEAGQSGEFVLDAPPAEAPPAALPALPLPVPAELEPPLPVLVVPAVGVVLVVPAVGVVPVVPAVGVLVVPAVPLSSSPLSSDPPQATNKLTSIRGKPNWIGFIESPLGSYFSRKNAVVVSSRALRRSRAISAATRSCPVTAPATNQAASEGPTPNGGKN